MEMNDELYDEITRLSASGDAFAQNENYKQALEEYWKAYDLLPEPKTQWDAATWLFAAIGDVNFLSGDYQAGMQNLSAGMHCPGAIGNPFLHLRLGQCQYEIGNMERAADEFTRAYALEGAAIFQDDDPKYFEFLKTKINI
jgi:tetratricopeptide (TPR) repeat protein